MRYNALMSQGSFLRIRERALRLGYSINLLSINYRDNEFQFLTKSQTQPGIVWTQRIQLQKKLTPEEVARMDDRDIQYRVLDGQLKVHCDCIAEGTLIFTKEGFKEIQNVHKGDYVIGGDGKWHMVAELLETEQKRKWVNIHIVGEGKQLTVSTDHKLLVSVDDTFAVHKLMRVEDIAKGMFLCSLSDKDAQYVHRAISSIEPSDYKGKGYDICLFDEPHTYVANNVIVSNCPAFLYWGFAYKAWMRGYGLVRETRRPIVRNPKEQGFVCKHLYAIMNAWKFYAPMIADRYKAWYEKK